MVEGMGTPAPDGGLIESGALARLREFSEALGRGDTQAALAAARDACLAEPNRQGYLGHLKPDGVLILHLSNRNLDLNGPAQAVAKAAGGVALIQHFRPTPDQDRGGWPSPEDAVIIGKSAPPWSRLCTIPAGGCQIGYGAALDRRLHQPVRGPLATADAEIRSQQRRLDRDFHADDRLGRKALFAAGEAHTLGGGGLDADRSMGSPSSSAIRARMASRCGLILGRSQMSVRSALITWPPLACASSTAWRRNRSEDAPFHFGSAAGSAVRCRPRRWRPARRR